MSLISTYDLRIWMGVTEGDTKPNAKLSSLIQVVEDFVDNYCNRKLEATVYKTHPDYSYLDGGGRSYMYLPQYPVSYITEINIDSERTFGSGTVLASGDYFWYPSNGKVVSEGGYFTKGRRNIRFDYVAGYAPVLGGTHNAAVSSYPIPNDLKQVMVEMCVQSFKEGMTAVHTIVTQDQIRFSQMLNQNTFWSNVLNKYRSFDSNVGQD